jgi:ubiquinone/menaquinone biosynthesis C-methylase UbiE
MKDKFKEAVKTYNKIAEIYSEFTKNQVMQFQLSKFSSFLPGKKILDVGCGPGRDSGYFVEDGFDVVGVDASEAFIKIAKKEVKGAKFKVMDFRKLDFKDNSFDGLWNMASLVHINRKEMPKLLKDFYRVLSPKGVIYISVREGEGDKEVRQEKYKNEPRHFFYYTEEEFKQYLEDSGFLIIESEVVTLDSGKKWLEIFARKPE